MKTTGKVDRLTKRVTKMTLVAEEASDEFLLREILRVMRPEHEGIIIVTHVDGIPEKTLWWKAGNKTKQEDTDDASGQ